MLIILNDLLKDKQMAIDRHNIKVNFEPRMILDSLFQMIHCPCVV